MAEFTVPSRNWILGFLYFWGIIFFITTTLVWFLKREKTGALDNETDSGDAVEQDLSIIETYKLLLKIFKLPVIRWTVVVLLTCKVTFTYLGSHFLIHYHLRLGL